MYSAELYIFTSLLIFFPWYIYARLSAEKFIPLIRTQRSIEGRIYFSKVLR